MSLHLKPHGDQHPAATDAHKTMTNAEVKDFALSLLRADSESEVIAILTKAGYWDAPDAWRLIGDKDGNFSTVGNQQSRPEAALVEKIINSVDARLLNECLVQGTDPESQDAPRSIRHAISVLFDGKPFSSTSQGTIAEWSDSKTLAQARMITLAVTGNKPKAGMPCLTISDAGEGQTPAAFPDTFLSIDKSNKLRIPFVQGKFNMGGTGALKFCGHHSLQLIISRRNPAILQKWANKSSKWTSSDPRKDEWGVTVVRRERPKESAGQVRNSMFKYLAPLGGQVLSFQADSLPIFPEENEAYVRETSHGSVIKLYEYDTKGFSSHVLMPNGLLSRLETMLPQIALPVRVHECREFKGVKERSFANSLVGLTVRLKESHKNLEDGYPTTASFVVRQEKMTAQIFAFKEDRAESYRTNEGVIFTVNGQSHGALPKTFYQRERVKMGRLAKSLLIIVDCSTLSVGAREDLFMNSRDRLSNGELRKEIEDELESIVRNHEGLRELRERRRAEEIANRLEESKPLEQILDAILKTSPTLSKLFVFGQRLSKPHRAEPNPETKGGGRGQGEAGGTFEGKSHPTYFRFPKMTYGEKLVRKAEIDRRCRIRFETDAQNDYFERAHMPGRYEVEVIDGPLEGKELSHSVTLHNGIANWSIKLPDEQVEVGDQITIQCTVNDDTLVDPFVNVATLTITPREQHPTPTNPGTRLDNLGDVKENGEGAGQGSGTGSNINNGAKTSGGIKLPPIVKVTRGSPEWVRHGFDETTACIAIQEENEYSFYINVDNVYLRTELKNMKADVAVETTKFIWGNVLIGLALLHDDREQAADRAKKASANGEERQPIAEIIRATTRALGPFLIPMIDHLGAITEEDVVALATKGDDA
jgi:hypothetical protein